MFSRHRGLASFAEVMTLGLAAALLYSVAVLPALLDRFRRAVLGSAAPAGAATAE
jgi:predicted RND superfamily exporter protein